jgi:hypothetical protein
VIQVWVGRVLDIGGGKKACFVCRTLINTPIRLVTVVRRAQGVTMPDHPELVNYTNSDTFLGRPAGLFAYMGAESQTNIALSSIRPFDLSLKFVEDSNGHFDFAGFVSGWYFTSDSPSANTWVSVSSLTGTGLVGTIPDSANFTDTFLAEPLV